MKLYIYNNDLYHRCSTFALLYCATYFNGGKCIFPACKVRIPSLLYSSFLSLNPNPSVVKWLSALPDTVVELLLEDK